jgi:hypothetical protein
MSYTPKTKEFFLARIGKRIYRDKVSNCCTACTDIENNGLIVSDEAHAEYLAMIDADMACENVFMNYRDVQT